MHLKPVEDNDGETDNDATDNYNTAGDVDGDGGDDDNEVCLQLCYSSSYVESDNYYDNFDGCALNDSNNDDHDDYLLPV